MFFYEPEGQAPSKAILTGMLTVGLKTLPSLAREANKLFVGPQTGDLLKGSAGTPCGPSGGADMASDGPLNPVRGPLGLNFRVC